MQRKVGDGKVTMVRFQQEKKKVIEPSTSASANVFSFRVCHELFKQKNHVEKNDCVQERGRESERGQISFFAVCSIQAWASTSQLR